MKLLLSYILILLAMSCKEKYDSPVRPSVTGYLVVDGVVNSAGPALLTLSRTTKFSDKNILYETGAVVTVEGDDNSFYVLADKGQGVYSADNLHLNAASKYRLRIAAKNGQQFLSDFVPVKNNPSIDSISWKQENNGVQLYLNTHDPQNNTRYYQWLYDETWEIQSAYLSYLKYQSVSTIGGPIFSVVYRDSSTFSYDTTIVNCWQFYTPTNIFIATTAKLSKDTVAQPLAFIPHASIELGVLYSMHVKQYAWTADGYAFLEKMKKNTETTGSVFDAQPSELIGNIHNTADTNEPVIGFFNVCPVQEKRIFIKNSDVPGWGYDQRCTDLLLYNISDSIILKGLMYLPTVVEGRDATGGIATYRGAYPECVDCTLRGTNKKPAYWP